MIESILLAPVLCFGGDVDPVQMVPENTFVFIECSDVHAAMKHFSESSIGKMMMDGASFQDQMKPMMADMASELKLKESDVDLPNQLVASLYVTFDEDLGIEVPAYFAAVSWDGNEELPKALFEDRMRTMALDANRVFEREQLRGREMIVVESAMELPDFDEAAMEMDFPVGDMGHIADSLSTQYIVRDGGRLMIASEPIALDNALRVIDGGSVKSLDDQDAFHGLKDMVPGGSADFEFMVLTGALAPLRDQALAGPGAMAMPIIQELFGEIGGYGVWMSMGTEGNVVEGGTNVLIEGEPRGLMKLLDVSRPAGSIPTYVPAEAISYTRVDFDFKNLIPTLKNVMSALPEAQAQQIEPMLLQFAPMMQSGLETLGPEVHVFTTPTQSEFEPTRQTVVIPTSNDEAINQMLGMFAPMMGLVPRDFNGETIYSDPLDEFNRMAVGVGSGSLLMGDIDGVEAVLRSSGKRDLPQLGRTDVARHVERSLPGGDFMLWGMIDLVKQAEAVQAMMAMMPMMLANADVDAGDVQDAMEEGLKRIDAKKLQEMLGPLWYYGKSTDRGFEIRAGILESNN